MEFYTIGVYGLTENEFFQRLVKNDIDTFIDIRRRRAVRGAQYAFANSNRLQKKLNSLNIRYVHVIELSPTNEIRNLQYAEDEKSGVSKRSRQQLSNVFITAYKQQILQPYSLQTLMDTLKTTGTKKAILFCVEKDAVACHRSLVAEKLKCDFHASVTDL